jgi:hypothetical protein
LILAPSGLSGRLPGRLKSLERLNLSELVRLLLLNLLDSLLSCSVLPCDLICLSLRFQLSFLPSCRFLSRPKLLCCCLPRLFLEPLSFLSIRCRFQFSVLLGSAHSLSFRLLLSSLHLIVSSHAIGGVLAEPRKK